VKFCAVAESSKLAKPTKIEVPQQRASHYREIALQKPKNVFRLSF